MTCCECGGLEEREMVFQCLIDVYRILAIGKIFKR